MHFPITAVALPAADASWDEWVEEKVPVFLNFVGLNQANIEEKLLCRCGLCTIYCLELNLD